MIPIAAVYRMTSAQSIYQLETATARSPGASTCTQHTEAQSTRASALGSVSDQLPRFTATTTCLYLVRLLGRTKVKLKASFLFLDHKHEGIAGACNRMAG